MSEVAVFQFSPFAENTYIVSDDSQECIIIDPGCYTADEEQQLAEFVKAKELKPVRLILTHAHLDHIFGNKFIFDTYGLLPEMHAGEMPVLEAAPIAAQMYGVQMKASPKPEKFLREGQQLSFGRTSFDILFTPGHSPASISFYNSKDAYVIAGDVLFRESIGRTDLPGGNMNVLLRSIRQELFTLPDVTRVYNGHGPHTTIGYERHHNPFLK